MSGIQESVKLAILKLLTRLKVWHEHSLWGCEKIIVSSFTKIRISRLMSYRKWKIFQMSEFLKKLSQIENSVNFATFEQNNPLLI